MRITVVTLFKEFFDSPLSVGLIGKALAAGSTQVGFVDPRAHSEGPHKSVDDAPYGGGPGMVMKPGPAVAAIEAARALGPGPVVLLTPQGAPFTQAHAAKWSREAHLVLVAGRYEGFDERITASVDEEISCGDFVLTGGEYAALTIIDATIRLVPGTLGNADSSLQDSFSNGLLEHPQYTRPPEFRGVSVPEVLLGGDHGRVAAWRRVESLRRTRTRRPDLLAHRSFDDDERRLLRDETQPALPCALAVATDDIAGAVDLAAAYGLAHLAVVTTDPAAQAWLDQARAVAGVPVASHRRMSKLKRAEETDHLRATEAYQAALARTSIHTSFATLPDPGCWEVRVPTDSPALRVVSAYRRLPVLAEAAIRLDRLLGEG